MRKLLTLLTLMVFGVGFAQAQITIPYAEDLEALPQGPTGCGNAQVLTAIQWDNTTDDDADWVSDLNGTGSSNTGPTANGGADHNPGVSGGRYLYIEASGCITDTANLVSEEIYAPSTLPNILFEFWYHQFGAQININILQARRVIGGNPQPWVAIDTLSTPVPGIDQWQQGFYDLSAYIGDTFQLRFRGVTGTSFGSDNALDDFSLYFIFPNDIGATAIDAPISPTTPGNNAVEVTIENFGFDTITNANINWQLNGGATNTFAYTGSLISGQSQSGINIGTANITTPLYTITAWTSMPNMLMDDDITNDTASYFGCTAPLRGTYTCGGSGADIPDIYALGEVLSQCGIDSHTVININPGVYQQELILDNVPGTDSTATLCINGGSPSLVTISGGSGPTIYLNGTDYTTIKNMTIEALGVSDAYGVQLRDTASYNTIDSCDIVMDDVGTGLVDVIGVSASNTIASSASEGQNAFWTTVSNNHIIGGEKGIHFEGAGAGRNVGNRFINNVIESAEDFGIFVDDQDSIAIIDNQIIGLRNAGADGISIDDFQMFDISGNEAFDVPDIGMDLDDMNFTLDATPTSRGRIVNNMISSISDHAVEFDDIELTDIFHNTFANTSGGIEAAQFNDFTLLDVRNNIFYSNGSFAVEADDAVTATMNTWDYNLYFAINSANVVEDGGVGYATLGAWQTASPTINLNSVSGDPVFVGGLSDLHVLSAVPNDVGDNTVGVMMDIDGDVRPAATIVDIGADEFTPLTNDVVGVSFIGPDGGCGDSSTVITVIISSNGQTDATNFPITVNFTGGGGGTLNFTYLDTLSFNETDTVIVGTVNTYNGGTFTFSGFTGLTGDVDASNDTFPPVTVEFVSTPPVGIAGVGCGVDTTFLVGFPYSGVAYNWFASPTDTVPISMSDSFLVPSIATQNTYYLEYRDDLGQLATPFNSNNGFGGNMWNVTATNTTTITNLAGNFDTGTTVDVQVYWRPNGTFVGNETNQNNDWILLGTATGITSAGTDQPTNLNLNFAATIPAGQTVGFYMQQINATTNAVNYTNGSSIGTVLASDANITIFEGIGKGAGAFNGSNFTTRNWNGIMFYGNAGCSTIRVPVTALSSPGVSVNLGNDTTLCGNSVTLDAGTNATFYNWSNMDTTQTSTVTMSGTYSVEVSDTFGCTADDTINLTLNIPPVVNLGPDVLLCDGATDTLDAGNAGSSYVWSSSANTGQTEPISAAGTVSVVVTDTNGCTGTDTIIVSTGVTPTAAFSQMQMGGQGLTYAFTDQSTGTPTQWSWNFGDNNTSTMQSPTHTYAAGGTYTVTLTVTNGCGTTDSTFVITAVGIEQGLAGGLVSLYPNPNDGRFNLEFSGLNSTTGIEMRVMNMNGQIILESKIEEQGSFVKEIDMTRFAKGMYLMQISAEDEQILQRFVVE
ncbi:MAG: PKD domain-containing protein [Bacteroidota bacterium]